MNQVFQGLGQRASWEPTKSVAHVARGVRGNEAKRARWSGAKVPNPWSLSPAEYAVAEQLALGLTSSTAAGKLGMQVKTVATHLMRLKEKMGAGNATHVALMFDRWIRSGGQSVDVEIVVHIVDGKVTTAMRELPKGAA